MRDFLGVGCGGCIVGTVNKSCGSKGFVAPFVLVLRYVVVVVWKLGWINVVGWCGEWFSEGVSIGVLVECVGKE